jgi:hypothetical protein
MKVDREVRVSIADLVWDAVNCDTGEIARIGILSQKELSRGKILWTPLGGAAILAYSGFDFLRTHFHAHSFEEDVKIGFSDLRCVIEDRYVETIFTVFDTYRADLERLHCHDIMQELKELDVFTSSELDQLVLLYVSTEKQKVAPFDEGSLAIKQGLPTRRLFRIYDLIMPGKLFEKLMRQKYVVRTLKLEEVATTKGGSIRGVTNDGQGIQNNFF